MKWGEYSCDVQFILQRSDQPKNANPDQASKNPASSPPQANESPKKAKSAFDQPMTDDKLPATQLDEENPMKNANLESIKTTERRTDLIGIVKGKCKYSVEIFKFQWQKRFIFSNNLKLDLKFFFSKEYHIQRCKT